MSSGKASGSALSLRCASSGGGSGAASASSSSAASRNGNGHGPVASARDEFSSLETIGRVRQAISTLPGNYREVVVLCELEEMSYEEAASALGCPVGTVRSRLHRARAILVEKLCESRAARHAPAVDE